ncbi:MAG: hypothetical protein CMJ31_10265 [Phycisphaerae bacterium]|nr:hypothetical protein [Phycisphaerae bacterium]
MTESLDETTLRQVYRGTRQMIGFLPSGRAAPESPAVVSCFWSLPVDDRSRPDRVDLEAWKRAAIALTPLAEGAVASVTDPSQLLFAQYFDVVIDRPWRGRAVVIGDAAHATSPQLGQGVNLGLADASELARQVLLDQPLESALAAYASRRRGPTRYYQQASRLLTPFFQSDATLLGTIRDACMGAACSFPPTRRQMLHALTGRKTGWLPSDRATPDANGRR